MNLNWNFVVGGDLREENKQTLYNLVCFLK